MQGTAGDFKNGPRRGHMSKRSAHGEKERQQPCQEIGWHRKSGTEKAGTEKAPKKAPKKHRKSNRPGFRVQRSSEALAARPGIHRAWNRAPPALGASGLACAHARRVTDKASFASGVRAAGAASGGIGAPRLGTDSARHSCMPARVVAVGKAREASLAVFERAPLARTAHVGICAAGGSAQSP